MALASFLRESRGERNRPPEPPRIHARDIPGDARLTFIDFVPSVIHRDKNGKIFYHPFRILMEVANKWLQHNFEWHVINCESVTLIFRHNTCSHASQWDLMPNVPESQTMGQEVAIKALRIWIKKREEIRHKKEKSDIQVLGYRDYLPERKRGDKRGDIEALDEVINRINAIIRDGKFEGSIVSVETLHCESTSDGRFDPEVTRPKNSDKTVSIIRVYYEEGPAFEEEIGIADFVPQHLSGGSLFSRPEFESFSSVIERASHWLYENPEINFRNTQTIDVKLKLMTTLDTRAMTQTDHAGDFIRILRLTYSKPFDVSEDIDPSECLPPPAPVYLSSQMFLLKSGNYGDLKKAVSEWYNSFNPSSGKEMFPNDRASGSGEFHDILSAAATDGPSMNKSQTLKCNIMSCETISVFAKNDSGEEESFNSNRVGARNRCTFISLRIYYDVGFYAHTVKPNVTQIEVKTQTGQGQAAGSISSGPFIAKSEDTKSVASFASDSCILM